jgi:hypothetical protein
MPNRTLEDFAPGVVPNHNLGPDALRCTELHDFSDLRDPDGGVNRPLIIVLVIAAVLTIGHFIKPRQDLAPSPVAQHQVTHALG